MILSTLHFQWCLPSVKEMLAIKFWRTSCSRMDSKTRNLGNGHMLQNRQRRNRRRKSHLTWSKCSLLHLLYLVPCVIDWLLLKRLFIHAHKKLQQFNGLYQSVWKWWKKHDFKCAAFISFYFMENLKYFEPTVHESIYNIKAK